MRRNILISASLFHALNDATAVTIPMIFPLLFNQQFIIKKYSDIGIMSNLGLLVTFLFQIIIAHHAHKFEYRHMLLISIAGISFSVLLVTLAGNFASMLLFYLLMRMFISLYHPVGIATVSRAHPDQGVDFAMGIQSGSGNLGVFSAFILAGFLAQDFGWKMPLYVCAMAGLGLGLSSFFAVRNISLKRENPIGPDFASWMRTFKEIKVYVLGFVFGGACWGTTVYYAPSLFNHKFKVPLGSTGIFLASWIGIGTVMTYSYGYLIKRIGRRKASILSLICSSFFLLLLGASSNLMIALVGLFFYGAFLFLLFPAFQSFVANKVPESNHVVAFSIVANIQMLTGALIVLISGFLSDKFGINFPFLFLGVLGILASTIYFLFKGTLLTTSRL
jgi:MFS family permease